MDPSNPGTITDEEDFQDESGPDGSELFITTGHPVVDRTESGPYNEPSAGSGTFPFDADDFDDEGKIKTTSFRANREKAGLWTFLDISDDIPPRAAHSADLIGDSHIVVFGGWNGTDALADLHIFDLHEQKWRRVETAGTIPSKRNNVRKWKLTPSMLRSMLQRYLGTDCTSTAVTTALDGSRISTVSILAIKLREMS
eukprot:Blabericola_migrator_1__1470@NODE_1388_length_4639_cov_45_054243_g334_i1_p3_GENE_NODE_1388_length_4639_cov_45_054243_g334_i1NODE_1388_length_4639_cov_45_054243_g334_i1_p3_ORF_typecomplete_len198_score18_05Kelch_4/PF13418_6/3_2e12Kelch_3/PF13415_6/1_4e02Kelch_3/PF13415_6/2_2e10Kelch_6/PF13964_6/3_8e11Kelch_6/PF13964_6/3_8e03Kelch_2/PF07646_15/4_1e11Kelch_1/PF01344_25/3_3e07Kelch_1/PF01344_25/4_1e03Kelch_5/PF13854_6/7_3e06_NODE_1388_length_4639_cov_45_054243_g334_i124753068